ncbi:MAG TPA: SpoIIE family protein phosphatase [Candidatus Limnocylindria bacterium]|nr:SpoIIE family protein phosphatase [Candidatus Limnocylindria bacterium]
MLRRVPRPLVVTALLLALAIPILIAGGQVVSNLVGASFRTAEQARSARAEAFIVLRDQLDEETGVRGFAANRQELFLEPYRSARPILRADLARLDQQLRDLGLTDATRFVADAAAANATWLHDVAEPLIAGTGSVTLERRGKTLVDRYRGDVDAIDRAILAKEQSIDRETRRAIERIDELVIAAVVVVGLVAIGFGTVQSRLVGRLEAQNREAALLQIAYATEKRIADTLQEAFLEKALPAIPTVRLSATYLPAGEEAKVGGDWYDGVELPGGRVLFAIGDVAGHGLDAAVAMNRARQSFISSALLDADPASVLAHVNDELVRGDDRMVTAVCGFADPHAHTFTYATAGHPPPILIEPGASPRLLDCGGLPLGVVAGASYRRHTVQTVPGAMLVLYTDGAVEHSRDLLSGETTLLEAIAHTVESDQTEPAAAICARIFRERAVRDDVAVLTVAFSASAISPGSRAAGEADAGRDVSAGSVTALSAHLARRAENVLRFVRRIAS